MTQDAEKRIEQRRDELMEREMRAWERGTKSSMTKLEVILGEDMAMNFSFHTYTVENNDKNKKRNRRLCSIL